MPQQIYGNNKIFCDGRFIAGPDARACSGSFLMILVPSIIWHFSVGKFLAEEYHPVLPVFAVIFQVAPLCFMLATAFSDPGIMPRQKEYSEYFDERSKTYRSKPPQRVHDLILRGHPFKLKYCTTCNIYRPPRCTHCSVCENCVERFDHHCPWIGNCIGKRNYWLFYSFVTTTGVLNVLVLASCLLQLGVETSKFKDNDPSKSTGEALVKAMEQEWLSAAMAVYCVALVWFTVGLSFYHSYLVCMNQTTYEQIKGVYSNGANPFNRGVVGNCSDVLCGKVRPRYFDPFHGRLCWPKQPQPLDVYSGEGKAVADLIRPEAVGVPYNSDAPLKEHEGRNAVADRNAAAGENDLNQESTTYAAGTRRWQTASDEPSTLGTPAS